MRPPRRCRTSGSSRRWTSVFLTSTSLLALHLLQGTAASGTLEGLERGGDLDRRRGSGGLGLPSFEAGPDAERGAYLGRRRPLIRGRGGGPGGGNGRHLVADGELSSPHLEMADVEYQYVNGGEEEEEEHPIPEPPSIVNIDPGSIDRCSGLRASDYEAGKVCGSPLTAPCFNRSRCDRLSIYVYDQECTLADSAYQRNHNHTMDDEQHQSSYWRDAVEKAGLLAESYAEACIFIHVNTRNHDEPCATRAPLWNGGVNHVMMEFCPWFNREHRPSIRNTYAMDWAFDHHSCFYRSGFDLSLPLMPKVLFPEYASIPATDRKYFMTFKGAIYLTGFGVEERTVVSRLDDEANGIVSVVKCYQIHGEQNQPENKEYCDRAKERYYAYDYGDLMDTTFALAPGGRSPGSFRLGEVMSAGAIPVFVVRDWVKPFAEKIDWPSFSFTFSPDDVGPGMVEVLRAVPPEQLLEMQRKSLEAFDTVFGGAADYSVIAERTIEEIVSRYNFH